MLFNSIEFSYSFLLVFLIHWFACKSGRGKNLFLIAASYLFYGWWNMKLRIDFPCHNRGLRCRDCNRFAKASPRSRKFMLRHLDHYQHRHPCGLQIFRLLCRKFHKAAGRRTLPDIPTLNLILPVGISFYSFQAMSYAIDVYRRKISATHDPAAFFCVH